MGQSVSPETFDQVTVGFTAVINFAEFVAGTSSLHVVDFLNKLFFVFDDLIGQYDVYKVSVKSFSLLCHVIKVIYCR